MASFLKVTLFGSSNSKATAFTPATDIPSLAGRTILITGGAGDLGRAAAISLAAHGLPAHIIIADLPRDSAAQETALSAIRSALPAAAQESVKLSFLDLDLGSLDAVADAARRFREVAPEGRLDLLVLNAGIMPVKAGTTRDGYEVAFGVNYLGHALLARLLLPMMVETQKVQGDVRVVVVASEGHSMAPKGGVVFEKVKGDCKDMTYFRRYGQSKVALIGLAKTLAAEYPQLKIAAVHPGRIATGLGKTLAQDSKLIRYTGFLAKYMTTTLDLGVLNHLWAAVSPDVQSGFYYIPVGILDKKTIIEKDTTLAGRLKEWTDNELKGRY
ncbi:hypothetical protein B0T16DRAFT_327785 [Cercophora newfieldiana]|uniref:NAD(P)-binding protein n=1 Tax=Cercophora newfieldiana TaxID=92897 RepID=A0AA39Y5W7_9PEZI|nr:hypothetical protein B0T16DRAFT_327785 [Cercophora newfieldiana]